MASRRGAIATDFISRHGGLTATKLLTELFPFWPVLPVFVVALWRCRDRWWFPPLVLWAGFIGIGVLLGFFYLQTGPARYRAPFDMAVFFVSAVAILDVKDD